MRFLRRLLAVFVCAIGLAQAADCPRIVSQSPYLTMALEWLGRAECIVGVSRHDSFRPALPRTGGILDPDAAAIAALKPDVVVTSDRADAATLAAAVPAGVRVVRLGGFGSMADTEAMLEDLALVSQSPEGGKVTRYRRGWFVLAKNSGARGERVLLLTACGDTPYSYGRRHVLGDLFFSAGFNVLEDDVAVRPLRAGEAFADLPALVAHHRPDIVFTFDRSTDDTCRAVLDPAGQRIIHLDGKNFLNPGPRLLDGLKELAAAMRHEATQ